jgi:hypothetical protein
MTQLEKFIDNTFVALQEKFPNIAIQYQYIIDTHFVKVTPFEVYDSEAFLDLDFEFSDKFDESDLEGMLCFITKDSLIELDNPSKVFFPNVKISTVELVEENIGCLNAFIFQNKEMVFRFMEKSNINHSKPCFDDTLYLTQAA